MNQVQARIDHCPQCGGDSIGPAGAGVLCDDCGWQSGKARQQSEEEATDRESVEAGKDEDLGGIAYVAYYADVSNPTQAWINAARSVVAPFRQKIAELERELAHEMASSGEVISRLKAERDSLAAKLVSARQSLVNTRRQDKPETA